MNTYSNLNKRYVSDFSITNMIPANTSHSTGNHANHFESTRMCVGTHVLLSHSHITHSTLSNFSHVFLFPSMLCSCV